MRALAATDDPGTAGLYLLQLYDDRQPTHRGFLIVVKVVEESAAAKAGIHVGDGVLAVDGVPTPGHEFPDIVGKDIQGPVGSTIRLTVVRLDGSQSEIALVRAPYPPRLNPASDPFAYKAPGSWRAEGRTPFPLPWSPALAYQGFEDLYFSPNFDQPASPEYHSFVFFMWLDGAHMLNAEQLQSDMVTYFRGLAEYRGRNNGFTPDLSKVAAIYKEDPAASRTFGGAPARALNGSVTIWDRHGKTITLNSEVLISGCGTPGHTIVFAGMSIEPRDGDMWKRIDTIRDTFRCAR